MIEHNDPSKTPLLKEKLWQEINAIVAETEYEERYAKCNVSNVTTDTFIQSPVITNTPRNIANVSNERRIYSESLTETIKLFNILTLQSTINYSADDHLKNVAGRDPKSDPLVDTHSSDRKKRKITDTDTTKGNSPHKLLTNREIPSTCCNPIHGHLFNR